MIDALMFVGMSLILVSFLASVIQSPQRQLVRIKSDEQPLRNKRR